MSVNQRQHQCERLRYGHGSRICDGRQWSVVDDGANLYSYSLHGLCTLPRYNHRLCEQHGQRYNKSNSLLPKPDNSAGRGADYQQQLRFFLHSERRQHQRTDDGLSCG